MIDQDREYSGEPTALVDAPRVAEAAVVGRSDPVTGQAIFAESRLELNLDPRLLCEPRGQPLEGGLEPEVVERLRALNPVAIVRGNHDKVACGLEQAEGFNSVAKSAARWTLETLTPEYRTWLCELPHGPILVDDVVEICHGSPFDEDAYIFDELDAALARREGGGRHRSAGNAGCEQPGQILIGRCALEGSGFQLDAWHAVAAGSVTLRAVGAVQQRAVLDVNERIVA